MPPSNLGLCRSLGAGPSVYFGSSGAPGRIINVAICELQNGKPPSGKKRGDGIAQRYPVEAGGARHSRGKVWGSLKIKFPESLPLGPQPELVETAWIVIGWVSA